MSYPILKFENEFNTIPFSGLSTLERNIIIEVLYRLQEQRDLIIEISYEQLAKSININGANKDRAQITRIIQSLGESFFHSSIQTERDNADGTYTVSLFHLFDLFNLNFHANHELKSVSVRINPEFAHYINNVKEQFTLVDVLMYKKLKSKYGKDLYKLLRQYRFSRYRDDPRLSFAYFEFEKFKQIMDFPVKMPTKEVIRRIKKAVTELTTDYKLYGISRAPFTNLNFTCEKAAAGSGGKYISIRFTFAREPTGAEKNQIRLLQHYSDLERAAPAMAVDSKLTQE